MFQIVLCTECEDIYFQFDCSNVLDLVSIARFVTRKQKGVSLVLKPSSLPHLSQKTVTAFSAKVVWKCVTFVTVF